MTRCLSSLRSGALALALLGAASAPALAQMDLVQRQNNSGEWVTPAKNYASHRYSDLNQITVDNVKNLEMAWSFGMGTLRGKEGQPLVVDNTMYIVTDFPNIVYALDLTEDAYDIKWVFRPEQNEMAIGVACCDVVNRGLGYSDGKIFLNSLDAHTYALDAETGAVIWKVKQGEVTRGETITMAPLVVKDKVISGISGGEFGVRGFVTANDINTGKQMWRAYSTGPDSETLIGADFRSPYPSHRGKDLGVTTWEGDQWKVGGGTTWGWYSYDPELDLIYYGTGNPGTWNPDQRPGDNKWSMTIFARDPDTGMAKWAYQMTPHDAWDYDGVNENILVDLPINGQMRKALVHLDRNGFGYTLDRETGEVLVAEPFGAVNWASRIDMQTGRPVENPEKRTKEGANTQNICPSAMGAKDQQPAAYSPRTKLIYSPGNWLCMDYEGTEVNYTAGVPYVGAIVKSYAGPGGHRGMFFAWDPATGKKVWENKERLSVWGGALATAGDVVFYGTMDGWFKAVDAKTGQELWKKKLGSGIIGAPMTYTGPDGNQYVAIYSGVGGWSGIVVSGDLALDDPTAALGAVNAFQDLGEYTTKGGTMYVFRLDQN
jgi:PQQ-dependent dehydrogenase (methanol/ethanol family)